MERLAAPSMAGCVSRGNGGGLLGQALLPLLSGMDRGLPVG